jgi:hypothetical protein
VIDQTRNILSPALEPEAAEATATLLAPADAALARAHERLVLRSILEGFCRRTADVAVLEFLFENDRLEQESAYELYEKVEAMYVNLADAVYVMGLLTPEEHTKLEALYPEDTPEERLGCALRINKDAVDYADLGLAERMRDEQQFELPAWMETAATSFPLFIDELGREPTAEEAMEELGVDAGPMLTEHGQIPAMPFIGGWWAAGPVAAEWIPEEES